jgi:hypothetical protein
VKKSFNIEELLDRKSKLHGTKPMHPSSLRAFQRHQEQSLKHPRPVDLISTIKTKQTTFLHRQIWDTRLKPPEKKNLHQFAFRLRISVHLEETSRVFFFNFEVTIIHEIWEQKENQIVLYSSLPSATYHKNVEIWKLFCFKSGEFGPYFCMESLNYIFHVEVSLLNIKQLSHGFVCSSSNWKRAQTRRPIHLC